MSEKRKKENLELKGKEVKEYKTIFTEKITKKFNSFYITIIFIPNISIMLFLAR